MDLIFWRQCHERTLTATATEPPLYTSPTAPTHRSSFAKYAKLHQLAHLHDPPRYLLAESDRITSPTHINREMLEHSECNRERVDVARCLLRSASRSFCRNKFSKRVLTTSPRGDLLLSGILANGNKAVLFTIGHLRGFSTSFDFFLLRGEARETHTHHS